MMGVGAKRALGLYRSCAPRQCLAISGLAPFKEAFAPELVERALHETSDTVRHIADPFGGSGTTALAAQFLGISPTTIEVKALSRRSH